MVPCKSLSTINFMCDTLLLTTEKVWRHIHNPPKPTENPVKKIAVLTLFVKTLELTPSDISKIAANTFLTSSPEYMLENMPLIIENTTVKPQISSIINVLCFIDIVSEEINGFFTNFMLLGDVFLIKQNIKSDVSSWITYR